MLVILAFVPYIVPVKATLTSKGQITIPAAIRRRLGLKTGQILEFDEKASFLKAIAVFDEQDMRSVIGCAKPGLECSSEAWLNQTRGAVELPDNADENRD